MRSVKRKPNRAAERAWSGEESVSAFSLKHCYGWDLRRFASRCHCLSRRADRCERVRLADRRSTESINILQMNEMNSERNKWTADGEVINVAQFIIH